MEKVLFYVMETEPMYYNHMMMNVLDMAKEGVDVKVVFESQGVKLPLELRDNELYKKVKETGAIVGVCEGCSKVLGVYDQLVELGYPMLNDMMGHAGLKSYIKEGYKIVNM